MEWGRNVFIFSLIFSWSKDKSLAYFEQRVSKYVLRSSLKKSLKASKIIACTLFETKGEGL